jgi:hypothetical protein
MEQILEGQVFRFTVVAKTASGRVVTPTTAAVTLDNAVFGDVTVNPDGTGGVFTSFVGQVGTVNLLPSAEGVTGSPFPVDVQADNVITSVEIVPDAVVSVAVQPA